MKSAKFSQHIGNIDDRLIKQAEDMPNFGQKHRNRSIRRIASIAAVVALMAGSFIVGALAISKEAETIIVKEPVYVEVEKEQEIIAIGDSGISLILPDNWKGQYGYEYSDDQSNSNYLAVYHLATRESFDLGGNLFWIEWTNERLPLDYQYPEPGFTIAITDTVTYRMIYPSDVQVDTDNPEAWAAYDVLFAEIKSIEIVMTAETLANTMNASNWVQGTVFAEFIDTESWEIIRTVDCDVESSRMIREIVEAQEFNLRWESFYTDLRIMFGGEEYYMSTASGKIFNANDYENVAILSAEDLSTILALLSE
jgi:hypothetical protein